MVEVAMRREPLDGAEINVRNRLSIQPGFPMTRFVLRGEPSAAKAAGKAFGVGLPTQINTAASKGTRTVMMLGPDEWLLIAPEEEGANLLEALQGIGKPHALVDVSHRNTCILVSGQLAADVLSSVCMLDLDVKAFPVGMATRTLFIKAEVVLWRTSLDAFHVEVWRSFADYLFGLLTEASREYVKI